MTFRYLAKLLLPYLLKKLIQSKTNGFSGNNGYGNFSKSQKEGDMKVNDHREQGKKIKKETGEYIDFEEIK